MWPTQPPTQWVPGSRSPGLKRPRREPDHPPPYSVWVNECVELYVHAPNTSSWRGAQLRAGTTLLLPFTFTLILWKMRRAETDYLSYPSCHIIPTAAENTHVIGECGLLYFYTHSDIKLMLFSIQYYDIYLKLQVSWSTELLSCFPPSYQHLVVYEI